MITASAPTSSASIAGGPYSWSMREARDGSGSIRSSCATESTSGSAAASELTITGVSESRHDEGVLVELLIDRGRDDVQVEPLVLQALNSFRSRQRADDDDRNWCASGGEQRDGVHQRATGREHRVDHDHRPPGERLRELVDV